MTRSLFAMTMAIAILVGACGDDEEQSSTTGAGGGGAAMPTGSGAGMSGGGGSGETTCAATTDCDAGQYCRWGDDLCGDGDPGKCSEIPEADPTLTDPVCGCDGEVYMRGEIAAAGVSQSEQGGCTAPGGTFECGQYFCDLDVQYCELRVHCTNIYGCFDFDAECAAQDCTCFTNNVLDCNEDANGHVSTYYDIVCQEDF